MREINEIIIHTTATSPDWMHGKKTSEKVAEIDRWHKARGWRGIGYHTVIDRDGTVAQGRPYEQQGAHVKGRNRNSIGVSLIGGRGGAADDDFFDHYTKEQEEALARVIDNLKRRFGDVPVNGHNQYANKGCPCFDVPKFMAGQPKDYPVMDAPPAQSVWAMLFSAIADFFRSWK